MNFIFTQYIICRAAIESDFNGRYIDGNVFSVIETNHICLFCRISRIKWMSLLPAITIRLVMNHYRMDWFSEVDTMVDTRFSTILQAKALCLFSPPIVVPESDDMYSSDESVHDEGE